MKIKRYYNEKYYYVHCTKHTIERINKPKLVLWINWWKWDIDVTDEVKKNERGQK